MPESTDSSLSKLDAATKFIRDSVNLYVRNNVVWRFCNWHKNQSKMQTGDKWDEVGWGPYEACREGGAIIHTGHEHSYERTHLLSSMEHQTVASTSNTLVVEDGKTFSFVSGLGGRSIRPDGTSSSDSWWASKWNASNDGDVGALICTFNVDGTLELAYCYFKDVRGRVADSFKIIRSMPDRRREL